MIDVAANTESGADQISHTRAGPQVGGESRGLGAGQRKSLQFLSLPRREFGRPSRHRPRAQRRRTEGRVAVHPKPRRQEQLVPKTHHLLEEERAAGDAPPGLEGLRPGPRVQLLVPGTGEVVAEPVQAEDEVVAELAAPRGLGGEIPAEAQVPAPGVVEGQLPGDVLVHLTVPRGHSPGLVGMLLAVVVLGPVQPHGFRSGRSGSPQRLHVLPVTVRGPAAGIPPPIAPSEKGP